ncbi:acyl carrier protein [Brasilonema sp. UFV-L1]|uniref:acyl carrier protein n=1 Tax=Brasilonema sp. UFV-L1 TaxID=2234130 RepID=UPI00145D3F01|nr:acyl carrier protein [Brasilonema sp. UFV-L1]NMG11727.1 acyl carrier protein [Brasilonema sp. UFV-L1]
MVTRYPITGDNKVETVRYTLLEQTADFGQVFINQTQYFSSVPLQVWNFCLGGYQICQKWLQVRKGCSLSNEEIQQYQRIVSILEEIVELIVGIHTAIQLSQLKNQKVFEKLQVIIAEQLGVEQNQVCLASNFAQNLGADSLDLLELFMVLEKAFNIQINDEVAKNISTVQKLVNYISQNVVI